MNEEGPIEVDSLSFKFQKETQKCTFTHHGGVSSFPNSCSILSVSNTAFHLLVSFQTKQRNLIRLHCYKSWAYWVPTTLPLFLGGGGHGGGDINFHSN